MRSRRKEIDLRMRMMVKNTEKQSGKLNLVCVWVSYTKKKKRFLNENVKKIKKQVRSSLLNMERGQTADDKKVQLFKAFKLLVSKGLAKLILTVVGA